MNIQTSHTNHACVNAKTIAAILVQLSIILGFGRFAQAVDVVVVCPTNYQQSMQKWVDYRTTAGIKVSMIPSQRDSKELQKQIAATATDKTRYVLLVGDAPVMGVGVDTLRHVPINYRKSTVTAKWGSTPTLSTDFQFGDLDNDGVPEACVGRLPVNRVVELEQLLARIISYENSKDFGTWRGDVQLVGGVGGFGFMADRAIETVTRNIVTSVLPTDTRTSLLYASPGHQFFPKDESFTSAVVDQYAKGARFWVYAGHGNVTKLDRVPQTRDGVPVLDSNSLVNLKRPAESAPIALILACYTGAIDASEDSFAENMLLTNGGPVAVFAGSRVTMPYGNTTAAVGLIQAVYENKAPRLGDAWLETLKQMKSEDSTKRSTTRLMIDTVAKLVSPAGTTLSDERDEHMSLYNLLGDPLLSMNPPQELPFKVDVGYPAGEPLNLEFTSPIDGRLAVFAERPLGTVVGDNPNDLTVASVNVNVVKNQPVSAKLTLPGDVSGQILIRAIVSGQGQWASGGQRTNIRPNSEK